MTPATLTTDPAPSPVPVVTGAASAPQRTVRRTSNTRTPVRAQQKKRSWKKTAMVIGGSTAAGAGVGALVGGKKGALIGAAVGAGGGTVYEVHKRKKKPR